MDIEDQTKSYFRAKALIELVFECEPAVLPTANDLNELLRQADKMLRPLEKAKSNGWVLSKVVVDTFPSSRALAHPLEALNMLMEYVDALRTWVGLILAAIPPFFGLRRAAQDFGEIYSRLLNFKDSLPALLENESFRQHCEECKICRSIVEDLGMAESLKKPPVGNGGLSN